MDSRSGSIDFSLPLSGSGPRTASQTVVFPRTVKAAAAGLAGYTIAFSGGDHHVGRLEVRLDAAINANTVTVNATLGLRDWSGNWDDQYDGTVEFAVVAELQSATAPPPRTDLIITDVELNQAVQFFRSDRFLDPANARPDNSIFLIARKNAGVRVYVDWDSSAGPITNLTGQLVVQTSSTTLVLNPINPGGGITPKRDTNINQALANDTLNFMIPAAWCVGEVMITCQVFDQAAPASKSPAFTRTLVFVPVAPLNLFLVGVGLTTPAAAAPSQATIANALSILIKTYPRGDIFQTGFTTITFGEGITGSPSSGCGSGFNDLLDRLRDLKGGSSDIYFGGLPAGVAFSPGNRILGCSPTGDGVAAAFVDVPLSIPHEVGHALGRKHDPCTSCSPPAQDPDSTYPLYDTFDSDSIGVFGFDPGTNTVFNPAATLDFMTAFLGRFAFEWISPYTYGALVGATVGGGAPGPLVNLHADAMTLFLGLTITRARKVTRRPSFHYVAPLQGRPGCKSQFTLEFLDKNRTVLDCATLHCNCTDGGCSCWPKVLRDALPLPTGARWVVLWEGDTQIYEEEIPDPPVLSIKGSKSQDDGVLVEWSAKSRSKGGDGLWYLVHWLDQKAKVWRGVAPRQQEISLLIPRRLFVDGPELRVRVLATSGIATGFVEASITLDSYSPDDARVTLLGIDTSTGGPQTIPAILTAAAMDQLGRQYPSGRTLWYDNRGAELARGNPLDLRQLGQGKHLVRAVIGGWGGRTVARSWLVERTLERFVLHSEVSDPEPKRVVEQHQHPHPPPVPGEQDR